MNAVLEITTLEVKVPYDIQCTHHTELYQFKMPFKEEVSIFGNFVLFLCSKVVGKKSPSYDGL